MLKTRLLDKINQINKKQDLLELSHLLHLEVTIEDLGTPIWVKIKKRVPLLNPIEKQQFSDIHIQKLINNVDKVRVVLVDGYYVNPDLQIKLKPEWVDIVKEKD